MGAPGRWGNTADDHLSMRITSRHREAIDEAYALWLALLAVRGVRGMNGREQRPHRMLFRAISNLRRELRYKACPRAGVDVAAVMAKVEMQARAKRAARAEGLRGEALRKRAAEIVASMTGEALEAKAPRQMPDLTARPRIDR